MENWEGHSPATESPAPKTPGVLMTPLPGVYSSSFGSSLIDSVDADDGLINGTNNNGAGVFGQSLWAPGVPGITFTFDSTVLGGLPTHAGLVWTDGAGTITFEAFGATGVSLGTIIGTHADGSFTGGTAEDRFYGAIASGGISSIRISNSAGGIEVDHLQYGLQAGRSGRNDSGSILGLLTASFFGLVVLRRFRQA